MSRKHQSILLCRQLYVTLFVLIVPAAPPSQADPNFGRDIRPLLSDACFRCHGPDANQRVSELRLDTRDGVLKSSDGRKAISPGDPAASELYRRITSDDPEIRMPPPESGQTLTAEQIETIRHWIEDGAEWQKHWAFVPPQRPEIPSVVQNSWCRNDIDHFVLARLTDSQLTPSSDADRRSLIRRVTLDLTGLPPTPEEITAYLGDRSPNAWEQVIDRLLRSPRYGEHMAVSWLDAARYADTSGYQTDGPREMWRWRDWVIDAFNSNMPFDRFTTEQLAGDLLSNASLSQKIATGFNRNHRGNAEGGIIPEEYQVEYVVDRVDTTATVWLGLTIGCARCHDHKYDPITQKEFYELFACFNNIPEHGRARKEGNSPPYIKAPTSEQQARSEELRQDILKAQNLVSSLEAKRKQSQLAWEKSGQPVTWPEWFPDGLIHRFLLDGNLNDSIQPSDEDNEFDTTQNPKPFHSFRKGQTGQAAAFDGTQFAVAGDVGHFGYFDEFSVSAWISPSQQNGTVLSRMVPTEQGSGYYLHLHDGHVQVNLVKRWLDDSIRVESRKPLSSGQWQHIAMTYDGSRVATGIRLYINGIPAELTVHLDGINQSFATDEPFRIGGGHSPYSGLIDDVRIYDRVLSEDEIQATATAAPVSQLLAVDRQVRTTPQTRKLYYTFLKFGAAAEIREAHRNLTLSQRQQYDFQKSIPTVMVMQEMNTPRQTYILSRGQYDAPKDRVYANVPAVLGSLPKNALHNRLGFARWLVSPDHPLTARVAVNRIWQMHFGTGLVATAEDFGAQGEPPTHPKLLDWLARKFIDSGWDMKALHKLIVSSATYRQSADMSAALLQKDPDNRLLARGPRFRLPAETVRDQALFVSGLLSEKTGGPSVRPYQPKGLWKEIASTTEYNQSHGKDLYRRSLYTYWKRTVAPPTMTTLDATARESCVVRRSRTNTPLQALALMNEVTFLEAARALAQRTMLETDQSVTAMISRAFERVTSRTPSSEETQILADAFVRSARNFRNSPGDAEKLLKVGESPYSKTLPAADLAAWTTVMSLILNLDETLTKG